jgi:hypothetical protein
MIGSEDLEAKQGKQAAVDFNGDFMLVQTYSGYRSTRFDPEGARHLLCPDASDESVGAAVMDALSLSRFLPLEEVSAFFDWRLIEKEYAAQTQFVMACYGYKTKRALFRNMVHLSVRRTDDIITITPSIHDQLEGWEGKTDEDIAISADSAPADVGAAVRLALSRCE